MKNRSNYPRFMLLWAGSMISQIGGGLTSFGLGVYIFNRTGSAAQMAAGLPADAAVFRSGRSAGGYV